MIKLKSSEILIKNGALRDAATLLAQITASNRVAIVTDSNVAPLYLDKLCSILSVNGYECESYIVPAGEESKTLSTVSDIYTFLSERNFTRTDAIIALGGGVIGDIIGFVSATYLRGVPSMQVPTSLLAQVDSSVGGKCGVDLPAGKNMVGAFNQPNRVLIDPDFLSTLTPHFLADGMAEVIKYGAIFDANLLKKIKKDKISTEIITDCVTHKRDIVEEDEFDNGKRMLLNFGHSAGHSIEAIGNYTAHTHGFAVSIGMVYAARLGEKLGITKLGTANELSEILSSVGLPCELPYAEHDILAHMLNDKKVRNGKLNMIMLRELGKSDIISFLPNDVINFKVM